MSVRLHEKVNVPVKVRFRPLGEKVLIQLAQKDGKTASGIILPNQENAPEKYGQVIAVGPGYRDVNHPDQVSPVSVLPGQTVLLPEYGGTDVTINGTEYVLVNDSALLGVLEEWNPAVDTLEASDNEVVSQRRDTPQA
jgi:chaperonin GroES